MRSRSAGSNWPSSGQAMAPGATPFTRTARRELERERARQRGEPGLGDAVERVALQRPLGVDVDDVDDRALVLRQLAAPPPAQMNSGARRFEPISSSQCDGSIAPTATGKKRRGVVHQQVEPAEALERRADQRARRDRREQLGLHLGRALRARRVQLGLELRRVGLGVAVVHAARSRPRRAGAARSPRRRAARRR